MDFMRPAVAARERAGAGTPPCLALPCRLTWLVGFAQCQGAKSSIHDLTGTRK